MWYKVSSTLFSLACDAATPHIWEPSPVDCLSSKLMPHALGPVLADFCDHVFAWSYPGSARHSCLLAAMCGICLYQDTHAKRSGAGNYRSHHVYCPFKLGTRLICLSACSLLTLRLVLLAERS